MPQSKHDLSEVLQETWRAVTKESRKTPLPNWNESVLRFFFVRALLRLNPGIRCAVEWHRIDLMVQDDHDTSLIEFKFYVRPWLYDLRGRRVRAKGGPGKGNFREFCRCVEKLANIEQASWRAEDNGRISNRYLVLSYGDSPDMVGPKSYGYWYDSIKLPAGTARMAKLATTHTVDGLHCPVWNADFTCKLLEVR